MEKKKFEPHYTWVKSVNNAWGASIYFVSDNPEHKSWTITCYAAPDMNARIAKPEAKEMLIERAARFLEGHPDYRQVNREEYDEYYARERGM